METIIIRAKSKRQAAQVLNKLRKIIGLKIETKKSWDELNEHLPNVDLREDEIMKEVRAVRYGEKDA